MKRQAGVFKKTVRHLNKPFNIEQKVKGIVYLVPFVENLYDELTGVFIDENEEFLKLKKGITIKQNFDDLGIDMSLLNKTDKVFLYEDFVIKKEKFSFLFIEVSNINLNQKNLKGYSPINFEVSNAISLLGFSILLSI